MTLHEAIECTQVLYYDTYVKIYCLMDEDHYLCVYDGSVDFIPFVYLRHRFFALFVDKNNPSCYNIAIEAYEE